MELAGEQVIRAPRQKVWEALNDPGVLSRCIPGCESVERISDSETHARVAVKVGPVRAKFLGKILLSDVDPPNRCTLNFEGSGGPAGFARGKSVVILGDEQADTRLMYSVEASVGGKLGQIGGRLIDSSARKMADDFFAALRQDLAPEPPAPEVEAPIPGHEPAAAPSAATAPPVPRSAPAGALMPELQRAFWFIFGAGVGLLICRLLS